jgi:hypothetical protein
MGMEPMDGATAPPEGANVAYAQPGQVHLCSRPAARREPLDITPVWTDYRAHRATRMASDLIERMGHAGREARSDLIPRGCLWGQQGRQPENPLSSKRVVDRILPHRESERCKAKDSFEPRAPPGAHIRSRK